MFKIYPVAEFEANCPVDNESLNIEGILIPGMRCLADTLCPRCGNRYFVDLPVGQAIWSPAILNQATHEIYDDYKVAWFSKLLLEDYQSQARQEIVPVVHKFFDAERIIIINCLDFLYGHSLLKLLNVQRYLDQHPDLGCCVLVPKQLVHLVPEGVAEIWEFPVSIKEGRRWYPSLDNWLKVNIASRKECFLSKAYSHPGNRFYDLRKFAHDLPDITKEINGYKPVILFNYREDRNWGQCLSQQQRNLQKLYDKLCRVFPDMVFVLAGFGRKNQIIEGKSKISDLRVESFDVETDKLWMSYMSHADCVIGVHGSNMLLPSGLAKTTIELVPRSRIGNTIQSFLFSSEKQDIRDGLLRYRMLFGDDNLTNILPSQVVDLVMYLLSLAPVNEAWFKVGEDAGAMQNLIQYQQDPVSRQIINNKKPQSRSRLGNKLKNIAENILWRLD